MTTTRIFLCRHGETDWNREGRYQGKRDIPLNARGREQAKALAEHLRSVSFDAAYTSPLSRAHETAEIVLSLQRDDAPRLSVLDGLAEISHGSWEGSLNTELEAQQPELLRAWKAAPHTVAWPGGESLADVSNRAIAAFSDIVRVNKGRSVLVAAHDAVNKAALLWAASAPLERFWAFKQDSTCLNVIDVNVEDSGALTATIVLMNSVAHTGRLFGELIHKAL